ncbi:MAG: helix-turn-helix transcriptional regulator [Gemmatimonadaceae bacterium]
MPSAIADLLSSLYGDDADPRIAAVPDIGRASLRGLTRVLDMLVEGVLILDEDGRVAYVNPALARLLCDEQERAELLPRMRRLADSLDPGADDAHECVGTSAEVRTPTTHYLLRATRIEGDVAGARRAAVVVAVERLTAQLPTAESLVKRFGLTSGEARVALLLAQGHSNCGIARALKISPHTARHHTESVLLKLDVHSRAEVGPKLLGTRRAAAPVRTPGNAAGGPSAAPPHGMTPVPPLDPPKRGFTTSAKGEPNV